MNPLHSLTVSSHSFLLILVNPARGETTAKINETGIALLINQDILGLSVTPSHACGTQTFDGVAYLLRPAKPILVCTVRPRRQVLQCAFILNIGEKQSYSKPSATQYLGIGI